MNRNTYPKLNPKLLHSIAKCAARLKYNFLILHIFQVNSDIIFGMQTKNKVMLLLLACFLTISLFFASAKLLMLFSPQNKKKSAWIFTHIFRPRKWYSKVLLLLIRLSLYIHTAIRFHCFLGRSQYFFVWLHLISEKVKQKKIQLVLLFFPLCASTNFCSANICFLSVVLFCTRNRDVLFLLLFYHAFVYISVSLLFIRWFRIQYFYLVIAPAITTYTSSEQ